MSNSHNDLRTRALKIAECPWAYASSDVREVIHELLARERAVEVCPICDIAGCHHIREMSR